MTFATVILSLFLSTMTLTNFSPSTTSTHSSSFESFTAINENCIVISIQSQTLTFFHQQHPITRYTISTAANGHGQVADSYKTPLGIHTVCQKLGMDAHYGTIFRLKGIDGRWHPGNAEQYKNEDLILTRVLRLQGNEERYNAGTDEYGRNVDSQKRGILIHGTNQEDSLGSPNSKGCIRMSNDDIIDLFEKTPLQTPVLITLAAG